MPAELAAPVSAVAAGSPAVMPATTPAVKESVPALPVPEGDAARAIEELVDALKTTSIGLRFEVDEKTNRVVTKVIDKDTGELIRQMPTEEVLRIARAIDKLQGLFVSQAA
jgi:flagellar protein FlaG